MGIDVDVSLKHKRGAVIAKNVKLPPRLSYRLLLSEKALFFVVVVHHLVLKYISADQ